MDSLGDRMKAYEAAYEHTIVNRLPIIIRCDGKGFSKWTKAMKAKKPFDDQLANAMSNTMLITADNIEGCLFGFTQSDEMTFVLRNDQSLESTPWFGNRLQKICSIVSSMVTAHFAGQMSGLPCAYFDTRVFAVPTVQEAINCLIWRQNDAVKNSISCSCYYEVANKVGKKTARKMMENLNGKQQQELLFKETGMNWNDYPAYFKRGMGCKKETKIFTDDSGKEYMRSGWVKILDLPTFSKEQEYLQKILGFEKA